MTDNADSTSQMEEPTKDDIKKEDVKVTRKSKKLPKCVRPEEFKSLIENVPKKDRRSRVAFLLAYGCGMRISEVGRCRPEHFRTTSIFIPESKYGVERIVPIPKGWKDEFLKELPLTIKDRQLERYFKRY